MTTVPFRGRLEDLNEDFLRKLKAAYPDSYVELQLNVPEDADMNDDQFWYIIGLLNWAHEDEDDDAVLAPAVDYLSRFPVPGIYRFHDILAEKLYQLDGQQYAEQLGEHAYRSGQGFSADNFLYARCAVVANGRQAYEQVVANPPLMPKSVTFEPLLYLAREAFQRKTRMGNFDHLPPVSYETFSNGAGWRETLKDKLRG